MSETSDNLADETLAVRACAGSLPAFEELVRRYQVPLHHFLAKRFPSRTDLDDILQSSFLKAWQSLHLYNPKLSFRTWMYTITYRIAVSEGRRDRPTKQLAHSLSSNAPAPHQRAQQSDDRHSLWTTAREVLTEEQFTALWLHYVDDLPARDVAKIMNRSWVNIKTLMYRARKKLEPRLAEKVGAENSSSSFVPIPSTLKAGEA